MTRQISRILFSGDFFRPSPASFRPTQHENIRWLAQLLGVPVSMASGLPCSEVVWDDKWENQPVFEADSMAAIYRSFWLEPSIVSWARIYGSPTMPAAVERLMEQVFADSLVIGFELPPILMHFFNRHGISFVDCALSPVRFMDDLLISISTSDPKTADELQPYEIPFAMQQLAAGVVSAHVAKRFSKPPRPDTLLLVLQTSYDKAVIRDGKFVAIDSHLDELQSVASEYSSVLVKPHPLEAESKSRDLLLRMLPNASETNENFYRLVSHPNLKGVAALSSSCIYEAGLFGKRQHTLMPSVICNRSSIYHKSLDVGDAILTPDFWRDVLRTFGVSVSAKDGLVLPSKPNRFRLQHRTAWGYNQIDTDISVAWANE